MHVRNFNFLSFIVVCLKIKSIDRLFVPREKTEPCIALCTTAVHNDMHTFNLRSSEILRLGFFPHFRFSISCVRVFSVSPAIFNYVYFGLERTSL